MSRSDEIGFADGARLRGPNADNFITFSRFAARAIGRRGRFRPPVDHAIRRDRVLDPAVSSRRQRRRRDQLLAVPRFIFDFCGSRYSITGQRDRQYYHARCGACCTPGWWAGRSLVASRIALGAALLEEFSYAPDGSFLAGTFAIISSRPQWRSRHPKILHIETRRLSRRSAPKGVGEGNCMSTPVCIANAVADALRLPQSICCALVSLARLFIAEPMPQRRNLRRYRRVGGRALGARASSCPRGA